MRAGTQVKTSLEMPQSSSGYAEPRTNEEFLSFRSGNSRDRSLVIFVASATELRLKKGDDLSLWGTAYVRFPRIPLAFFSDDDWADVSDVFIELIITKLSMTIRRRLGKPEADVQPMIERISKTLSVGLQQTTGEEQIRQKVGAALGA